MMTTDLNKTFEFSDKKGLDPYLHANASSLLEQSHTILAKTNIGQELLDFSTTAGLEIFVLRGQDGAPYVPEVSKAFITCAGDLDKPSPAFILDLITALREAQQLANGYTLPDKDEDPQNHANIYHSKRMDVEVSMCKFANEYAEKEKNNDYVDILYKYGYGTIYEATVSQLNEDELFEAYNDVEE